MKRRINSIPQTLYSYWGGKPLSFLRRLTLQSFHKYNPDWKIVLYVDTKISNLDFVEQKELPEEIKLFCKGMAPHHISDVLRWYLLYKQGGIWADMDILFIKPLPKNIKNSEFMCFRKYHSIGFLGSYKGNTNYKTMYELITKPNSKIYNAHDYQCFGSRLLNKKWQPTVNYTNIPKELVYPFEWDHPEQIFNENNNGTKNTIGIHWYGGNPLSKKWDNLLTATNYDFDNTICKYIKEVLHD